MTRMNTAASHPQGTAGANQNRNAYEPGKKTAQKQPNKHQKEKTLLNPPTTMNNTIPNPFQTKKRRFSQGKSKLNIILVMCFFCKKKCRSEA